MKKFYFLLMLLTASLLGHAQTYHQQVYWIRYFNQINFNDKVYWVNEIDNRRIIHPDVQNQLIMHSHLHYQVKNIDGAIGLTGSWIHTQIPEKGYKAVVPEIRPFQEVTYSLPLTKKLKFQQRLRVDDRFTHKTQKGELVSGYDFKVRFRFRSQLSYKIGSSTILKLQDEVMYHTKGTTFDQNRIYFGVEYQFSKKYAIEIGYMHLDQKLADYKGYYSRDIGRFTFYHRLTVKHDSSS